MNTKDDRFSKCPMRHILSLFSDKWSLLVICNLHIGGTMRFSGLASSIPDISERMLTVRLKRLTDCGLVTKKTYKGVPPNTEYSLTEHGNSLIPPLENLVEWAMAHFEEINKNIV